MRPSYKQAEEAQRKAKETGKPVIVDSVESSNTALAIVVCLTIIVVVYLICNMF